MHSSSCSSPRAVVAGDPALDRAVAELADVVAANEVPMMRLVDCREHGQRPPLGSIYIGRKMPGVAASALANPYTAKSRVNGNEALKTVVVPDDAVLERYKRYLTHRLVEHPATLEVLRSIPNGATLACWCVERHAARVGVGGNEVETQCHGDVVFTIWAALRRVDWQLPWVTRGDAYIDGQLVRDAEQLLDFQVIDRTWAKVYELAFGERMRWGRRGDS